MLLFFPPRFSCVTVTEVRTLREVRQVLQALGRDRDLAPRLRALPVAPQPAVLQVGCAALVST